MQPIKKVTFSEPISNPKLFAENPIQRSSWFGRKIFLRGFLKIFKKPSQNVFYCFQGSQAY